ncbi:GtrA family protein [Nocardia sp. 2]|uniref:GtrA family protein n=1 Tax=Nocardia acididurans TaxID=2802282 RepID=A0ABS1MEV9_9NOCA|nr:GtrA family protein [Nocardia acididurans]MBL1079190.1 GtrA family protein [Nocardia acididurans]
MAVLDIPQRDAMLPVPTLAHTYAYGFEALRTGWTRHGGALGAWLRSEHALAQLIRFALVGGLSNIGYLLLFMALYGGGVQMANLAGSVVSTALANELHRRLTFHAAGRVRWFTAQIEGGGLALAGLAITSASLAVLGHVAPGLTDVAQALAVLAITAAVGTLRFLTLRLWVF